MKRIITALCWAAAIVIVAVSNRLGLIADESATVCLAILPALAVVTMSKDRSCGQVRV